MIRVGVGSNTVTILDEVELLMKLVAVTGLEVREIVAVPVA